MDDASPPPATPARLAASATAAGCARMASLRAALSAALRAGLAATDFEARDKNSGAVRARAGARARAPTRARASPPPPRQEFRACFPDFGEDVCVALHDLYRQVLHSARAHAEVGAGRGVEGPRVDGAARLLAHTPALLSPG